MCNWSPALWGQLGSHKTVPIMWVSPLTGGMISYTKYTIRCEPGVYGGGGGGRGQPPPLEKHTFLWWGGGGWGFGGVNPTPFGSEDLFFSACQRGWCDGYPYILCIWKIENVYIHVVWFWHLYSIYTHYITIFFLMTRHLCVCVCVCVCMCVCVCVRVLTCNRNDVCPY